jgi:zinc/manganese transport system permease protein
VNSLLHAIFAPGFFGNEPVQVALGVGGLVAVVSGVVGTFTVLRGQAFAGHAVADVGATGGSAAFLIGVNPLFGFIGISVAAGAVMETIGLRRPRGRDLATGIVLGAGLGLAALFLYLDATVTNTTGATVSILFGSIFVVDPSMIPLIAGLAVIALGLVLTQYRPLLLSSIHPDLAAARGIGVRLTGMLYLLALALAVSLSALTIGAILSTALLIGPAAAALRLTSRPGAAMGAAALIGLAATWLGVLLSYDSFYWPPRSHGWPVSFFVVTLVFVFYLLSAPLGRLRAGRSRAGRSGADQSGEPGCSPAI